MCTAICYRRGASYFGRNLDLHRGYGESVVITPRNYEINMRCEKKIKSHFSMIGMACVANNFPLYFEATNEEGLSAAGLNFPENASYNHFEDGKNNVIQVDSRKALADSLEKDFYKKKDTEKSAEEKNPVDVAGLMNLIKENPELKNFLLASVLADESMKVQQMQN